MMGKENMMGLYVGMAKMIPPCSTSPALPCPTLERERYVCMYLLYV